MSGSRVGTLFLGLTLLAGCASTPPHEKSVHEIREFADAIARVYDVHAIPVLVGPTVSNEGGHYTRGLFAVSTTLLTSPHRDKVVAHEMAHYILGHEYAPARIAEQNQRELDANALAVEIFVRVKGWREEQALRAVYGALLSAHRAVERGLPVTRGHLPPCQEIADLLGRFPRHAGWTGALECAPPAIVAAAATRPQTKSYVAPVRAADAPGPLLYAYLTDVRPARGVLLSEATTGGLPRARTDFFVDGDRTLLLLIVTKNVGQKVKLQSRWLDPDGILRRSLDQTVDQTEHRNAWVWATHGSAVSDLWLYPGRWTVRVSVNDIEAVELTFTLAPGAGQ